MLLKLEGVWNFRDFGGLPTVDGGRIRYGLLFRSANFAEATAADVAILDALDVRLVADLRHLVEREDAPGAWPGPRGPAMIFRAGGPASAQQAPLPPPKLPQPFSAAIARGNMLAAYRRMPFDPETLLLMRRLLRSLADHGGPIVVHCTSGKDRTGFVCAVIQTALGVSDRAIMADYLRTNDMFDVAERRRRVRADLEPEIGRPLSDQEIDPLLGVEPAYLAAALSEIEAAGGMEVYLRHHLGLTPAAQQTLRTGLCE